MIDNSKMIKTIGELGLVLVSALMTGCPRYEVWQQELKGKAELARAELNRKTKVLDAQAKKDSAKMLADAEIERTKGVAEADKIIGDSLKGKMKITCVSYGLIAYIVRIIQSYMFLLKQVFQYLKLVESIISAPKQMNTRTERESKKHLNKIFIFNMKVKRYF